MSFTDEQRLVDWMDRVELYHSKQAKKIFDARLNRNGSTIVLGRKPQPSPKEFDSIIIAVRAAFESRKDMSIFAPYIDILEELGGGLKALDPRDLFLYEYKYNVSTGWHHENTPAAVVKKNIHNTSAGYAIRLLYACLLSWTKDVAPVHPDVASRYCLFESRHLETEMKFSISSTTVDDEKEITDAEEDAVLRILVQSVWEAKPGYSNFYVLFKYQSATNPGRIDMDFTLDGLWDFFKAISTQYQHASKDSLPLKRSYKWYSKPIDEMVHVVFQHFLSQISSRAAAVPTEWLDPIIDMMTSASERDIRVARSVCKENIIAIFSTLIDRVHKMTAETYPRATSALGKEEKTIGKMFRWIEGLYFSLCDCGSNGSYYLQFRADNVQDSEDAKATGALAASLEPLFLRILTSKTNPVVYCNMLDFLNRIIAMPQLPDQVPLSVLTKQFWAAIKTVFTEPYVDDVDAVRLHHSATVASKKRESTERVALTSAHDWNTHAISICSSILNKLCTRGMVRVARAPGPANIMNTSELVKLGIVGVALLKRGVVQFLLEQDSVYPTNHSIAVALVDVLNTMSRSRDGRLLMLHSSEVGSRLAGIELLRYFFLHSDWNVVSFAFILSVHLLWDEDWQPLILGMEPHIEDLVAKWASLAILHLVQTAQKKFEQAQVSVFLEKLCEDAGIAMSSLSSIWPVGEDHKNPNLSFRRCATFLPTSEKRSQVISLLHRCLLVLCELSGRIDHIGERLRRRNLIELIAACTNFPPNSQIWNVSMSIVGNLLAADNFHPSDLADPQQFINEIVSQCISAGRFLGIGQEWEIPLEQEMPHYMRLGKLFTDERSKPDSEWKEYLIKNERRLRDSRHPHCDMYERIFLKNRTPPAPSSSSSSSSSARAVAAAVHTRLRADEHHQFQNTLLQLKECANGKCKKVELNRGEYKTCSKCRSVWYCSRECQTADWKRHKVTDCEPSNS